MKHALKKSIVCAAAITFASSIGIKADEHGHMTQRAAANHFELRGNSCCEIERVRKAASAQQTTIPGGKARVATEELRKPVFGPRRGLDIVHAPRPITASKDPNFESKWKTNAQMKFEVAPLK